VRRVSERFRVDFTALFAAKTPTSIFKVSRFGGIDVGAIFVE
jgi:hypothetical protein